MLSAGTPPLSLPALQANDDVTLQAQLRMTCAIQAENGLPSLATMANVAMAIAWLSARAPTPSAAAIQRSLTTKPDGKLGHATKAE